MPVRPACSGRSTRPRSTARCSLISRPVIWLCAMYVASVRPGKWPGLVDLACVLGGPNPALPLTAAYSQAHYDSVMKNAELAELARFNTLFVDSITDAT